MRARSRKPWEVIKALLPYLWLPGRPDLKTRVILSVGAVLLGKVVQVSVPFFYQAAVDGLASEKGLEAAVLAVPVIMILGYGFTRMVGDVLSQARFAIYANVREALVRALSLRVFEHLHGLSLRFHLERRTGAMARIVGRGVNRADFLLSIVLFTIIPSLIELVLVCAILLTSFGPMYVVATLVAVVVYIAFTFWVSEWRKRLRREMNDIDTMAGAKVVDSFLNYETVKGFTNEAHEHHRYDEAQASLESAKVKTSFSLGLLNAGQAIIFTAALAILMLMAGFDVASGAMTVGAFVMVNALLIQLSGPLNSLGFVYREIQESMIDTERMLDVLDVEPEIEDKPGAPDLRVPSGAIRFEAVDFHYAPDRQILHGVDITVPAGGTVAVVGPTGAGKSTLARLLFRFYDATGGRITIDGQDLRDVTQASLRAAIGIVPQDTVLFNDTIGYNIRYGRPGAREADVVEAARLAQISGLIDSLPKGYDTLVGERGLKLSGGEKQRIAIARTILKNPPILVLDEATSALDTQTERDIQTALKSVAKGRTTLVIAHRLSTIMDADEIVVLEAGRVAERGTHGDLIARGGLYAAMWERQRDLAEAERLLRQADEDALVPA